MSNCKVRAGRTGIKQNAHKPTVTNRGLARQFQGHKLDRSEFSVAVSHAAENGAKTGTRLMNELGRWSGSKMTGQRIGDHVVRIDPVWDANAANKSKLIVIGGMVSPLASSKSTGETAAGSGKSTLMAALAQAAYEAGICSLPVFREGTPGPNTGAKGLAVGDGLNGLFPREQLAKGFDWPCISMAHNEIHGYALLRRLAGGFTVTMPRSDPLCNLYIRDVVGKDTKGNEIPMEHVIVSASDLAAMHARAVSAEQFMEMTRQMVIGKFNDDDGRPLRVGELNEGLVHTTMMHMMNSFRPILAQTANGAPVLVFALPFANVAHGSPGNIALMTAASITGQKDGMVWAEGGFAFHLGVLKMITLGISHMNATVPGANIWPSAAVITGPVSAMRIHGEINPDIALKPARDMSADEKAECVRAVQKGAEVIIHEARVAMSMGIEPVVVLNAETAVSRDEIDAVAEECASYGIKVAISDARTLGSRGVKEALGVIIDAAETSTRTFTPLYDPSLGIAKTLKTLVEKGYAGTVEITSEAMADIEWMIQHGMGDYSVCISSTDKSMTTDSTVVGLPKGHVVKILRVIPSGAGFAVAECIGTRRMPGLVTDSPLLEGIRTDVKGNKVEVIKWA